jgi:hypothetical protein
MVASPLIIGVVMVGLVANTLLPVPVFVTLTRFLDASVATALEAVNPAILAFVPTYSALATPTPPAVMIDPVETLEESVVNVEEIPCANGMRAVAVV